MARSMLGFNYTRSSGVAQFNLNSDTVFRKPASSTRLGASADGDPD